MNNQLTAVLALLTGLGGIVAWRVTRMPKQGCIYPHCSASRDRCLHVCPHWRADRFEAGIYDQHSDYTDEL